MVFLTNLIISFLTDTGLNRSTITIRDGDVEIRSVYFSQYTLAVSKNSRGQRKAHFSRLAR